MAGLRTASSDSVHPIGIGTWEIASKENPALADQLSHTGYKNVEPRYGQEAAEIGALQYSLLSGQNYLDTAGLYGAGYTNQVVGRALAGVAESVPREKLFISYHIWKSDYGNARAAVRAALAALGTPYLDAVGPHSPHTEGWSTPPWQSAVAEVAELMAEGTVRSLSVSNFSAEQLEEVERLVGPPVVTAHMGFSVVDQKREVVEYCKARGIQAVGYRPLAGGAMGAGEVRAIAREHGAQPAQVCLAYVLRKAVLPVVKAVDLAHIDDNLKAVHLELTEEEMARLESLGPGTG